ncbi:MAG: protein-glutamate O-methyltransferase CheR [Phycisphaerae bacterium]|nr:protein-glutamate O-methyltransferase CheR [Phycisphaerae bacterium]
MQQFAQIQAEFTEEQFEEISALVHQLAGIHLHEGKKELVKSRLAKRTRQLQLRNLNEYITYVREDTTGRELILMLDAISTNLTFFFRESKHFDFLRETILPSLEQKRKKIRIWSAGCSSGEEPYSVAILLHEVIPSAASRDIRILATDLSTRVLAVACRGEYGEDSFRDTPPPLVQKYFDLIQRQPQRLYRVSASLRNMIHFARLNLMDPWPMKGPFDVIFCRNVMIYFDKPTQNRLVNRFYDLLTEGGALLLGHSESLTGTKHRFRYHQPATYVR